MIRALIFVAIALSVAGCGISRQGYSSMQKTVQSEPAKMKAAIDYCLVNADLAPAEKRERYAARFKIPMKDVSRNVCTRIVKAMADNRLTYDRYRDFHKVGPGFDFFKAAESL